MEIFKDYSVKYKNREFVFSVNDPEDEIQRHHVKGRFYEIEELDYLRTLIPPKSIVLDIGANVGNHSIFFSLACKSSMVIPFELNESALKLLELNIKNNNITDIIDTGYLGYALGNQDGFVAKLASRQLHNLGSTAFVPTDKFSNFRMHRLDSVLKDIKPSFIKIDVEGMELDVLDGALNVINNCRPILFTEVREPDVERYFRKMNLINYRTERTFQRYRGVYNFLSLFGR